MVFKALSSEDEEFPGWDSLDKDSAMVPSWCSIGDIRVVPLLLFKVENEDVGELHLRVPSTIDVDFLVTGKDAVSTSSFWAIVLVLESLPSISLEIEGVQVIE